MGADQDWTSARLALFKEEIDLERRRAELTRRRQQLPWVEVTQDYEFETEEGPRHLRDLFQGRSQLVMYHFMTPHEPGVFCTSCSFWIDQVGHLAHLHARDVSFAIDCVAPLDRALQFRERMGWDLPWVSSEKTSFYQDMHTHFPAEYHAEIRELLPHIPLPRDVAPGISAFVLKDGTVHRNYCSFTFTENVNSTYGYLDYTAYGRQEEGLKFPHEWLRYHDEYPTQGALQP